MVMCFLEKMLEALDDIGDKPEKEKIQETKTSKRVSLILVVLFLIIFLCERYNLC